jgi:DNA-binding response OmpR family regulator
MQSVNILVIEDDEIVARTIERSLRGQEFRVTVANSGVEGLKVTRRQLPDLVIMDIIMPGMDGYSVCREMRADPLLSAIPILFLTAKAKDEDRIQGFLAGADDYLTKPFNIDELILRIRAILRRTKSHPRTEGDAGIETSSKILSEKEVVQEEQPKDPVKRNQIQVGDYVLHIRSYELVTPNRGKVRLTPVQFDLLYHLMSHPGEIFPPARLLDEVWDYPSDAGSPDLVRVHIKNLRERIEANPHTPEFIQTIAGYGYTIRLDEE